MSVLSAEDGATPPLPDGVGTVVTVLEDRMDKEELEVFLNSRARSGMMMGSLRGYASMLYALDEIGLNYDAEIANHPMQSPFFEKYKPTWRELLNSIARQVQRSWSYNHDTGFWELKKEIMSYPYGIKTELGWKSRDQGNHVVYVPPFATVGMDVYMMGSYSGASDEEVAQHMTEAKAHCAMLFAKNFDPSMTVEKMETVKVGAYESLHFKFHVKQHDIIWRQWAVADAGHVFLIVSAIKTDQDELILSDVEKMIASFQIKTDIDPDQAPEKSPEKNNDDETLP